MYKALIPTNDVTFLYIFKSQPGGTFRLGRSAQWQITLQLKSRYEKLGLSLGFVPGTNLSQM